MSLADVLHSDSPTELTPDRSLYGFLIGDWTAKVVAHEADGRRHESACEIHAGWVLEGRAIQDVWMIPDQAQRRATPDPFPIAGNWYGTTLRVFDPKLGAWRIFWIDPATNNYASQIGRAVGAEIVQQGDVNGRLWRWRFTKITPASFHWLGELSVDPPGQWRLVVEVLAQRAAT